MFNYLLNIKKIYKYDHYSICASSDVKSIIVLTTSSEVKSITELLEQTVTASCNSDHLSACLCNIVDIVITSLTCTFLGTLLLVSYKVIRMHCSSEQRTKE